MSLLLTLFMQKNAFSSSLFKANIMLIRRRNRARYSAHHKGENLRPQTLKRRLLMHFAAFFAPVRIGLMLMVRLG